jgi:hypothetical protein
MKVPIYARDGSVKAEFLIDDEDADRVCQWRWRLNPQGYVVRNFRRPGAQRGKFDTVPLARFLLGIEKVGRDGVWVDHINRDRLDNRKANLRICDGSSSPQNRSAWGKSKYRGVSWRKDSKKWVARVWINGTSYFLGYFDNEDEAGAAAAAKRAELQPLAVD